MKFFKIFCLLVIASFALTGCNSKGYNFEKITSEDVEYVSKNYEKATFFESRIHFNAFVDKTPLKDIYIDKLCNLFQSNDTVIMITHEIVNNKKTYEVKAIAHASVMEDSPITYPVKLTLNNALASLRSTDIKIPHTQVCTFRRPFGPNPNNNPQYIFIRNGISAFVNANTGYISDKYDYERDDAKEESSLWSFGNLDHDIYVRNVTKIIDTYYTGFDVTVGPTGWPVASSLKWEVALYEDANFYYARLILHEYMLWWSWDDPYIAVKIPKCNVDGNLATNEKLRNNVLWKITDATYKTYDYKPYIKNNIIEKINGHVVSFGNYACRYEKYFVICDTDYAW